MRAPIAVIDYFRLNKVWIGHVNGKTILKILS